MPLSVLSPGGLVYEEETYLEEDFKGRVPRTLHVSLTGTHTSPFMDWSTASTTIQAAIDVALPGDTVLVADGTYDTGGRAVTNQLLTNRVVINKAITVRGLNGPDHTFIVGKGPHGNDAVRCAYVGSNAVLSGFTLVNGHTHRAHKAVPFDDQRGGGAWCESSATISNCTINGNFAIQSGGGAYGGQLIRCTVSDNLSIRGGGVSSARLSSCLLVENRARERGGGVYSSILDNCTLVGNRAPVGGGGASTSELNNCIAYYNESIDPLLVNVDASCTLQYTCTFPLSVGEGNIDSVPLLSGMGQLSTDSPCRGAGSAEFSSGVDLGGDPWGLPPSMGCDEVAVGSLSGALGPSISVPYTRVVVGSELHFVGYIEGRPTHSTWSFGDGHRHQQPTVRRA